MRRLTAVLLASAIPFAAIAQDAASDATRTAQAEIARRLPLDDPRDEANVRRGKLAEIPGGVILDKQGKTVWDRRPYEFLQSKDAPDTVNPSLWRQARLDAVHGLFEVVPGKIWQIRGYDISVMTIIRGKSGWIVVDPLLSEETAAAGWKLFADTVEAKDKVLPIRAVIFSHSHSDHFGGVGGIVTPEEVKAGKVRIIAPHGFSEEATSENVLAGTAMGRRALYMFGSILAPGERGQVDTGLGPKLSSGTIGYMEPTETVSDKGGTLTIDGLAFDFMDAGGTEAPAEFVFYIPAYKALHTTEVVTHNLHNILTLRGAQVRDALRWSKVIDAMLLKWGGSAEVAMGSHHWPTWGTGEVSELLANQRDAYRYVHDRTLFLANKGATLHELADQTAEAPVQGKDFGTRGYYGTLNHDMKATYQRYFGWWDGNPANFNPLPPEQSAPKYVALAGGADKLLAAGKDAIKAGDYRWAAELLNKLVFAQPDNKEARAALASAYDQMGYQAESGAWRNYYLAAAASLRGNAVESISGNGQSRSFVSAIPTGVFFDALATRFDAAKGAALKGTFQFILPDSKEAVAVVVGGGVEFPRYGVTDPAPTATITIDRGTLDDVMLGQAQFPALMQSGAIKIDGDRMALLSWFALHPPQDPRFNIVVP
ncbi:MULTISPECIES: alkyl sulfatase dimerization domain-containing protein [unclassified Sphingopyxis]|uniref:alkyl/aryl-sulfatase n=1 Tax=unclassified Sphingopyxis TaxID=2614943 RepID=UPI00073102B8|nr:MULTISPECIES: alkyl sulfatase dimerization domain-containing protein [unclassified Sphingopyxis]KTE27364.1 MBL fold metallo-hydrolase [Sphingopyxis sp. H057]KTE54667.1 MBL fold metallo-hydrolase [Sphingopyxis sp. H073]KTE56990.1 MBL fold metallo-hydrolase [Sphingopyxis sp. H071]KTE60071.1 MBL fold metallo-hydrolase [Sphingopyxis sp. H107]KTE67890.1 MBL fold metallo-hydrolase [Sphingopyxis sp. H100]